MILLSILTSSSQVVTAFQFPLNSNPHSRRILSPFRWGASSFLNKPVQHQSDPLAVSAAASYDEASLPKGPHPFYPAHQQSTDLFDNDSVESAVPTDETSRESKDIKAHKLKTNCFISDMMFQYGNGKNSAGLELYFHDWAQTVRSDPTIWSAERLSKAFFGLKSLDINTNNEARELLAALTAKGKTAVGFNHRWIQRSITALFHSPCKNPEIEQFIGLLRDKLAALASSEDIGEHDLCQDLYCLRWQRSDISVARSLVGTLANAAKSIPYGASLTSEGIGHAILGLRHMRSDPLEVRELLVQIIRLLSSSPVVMRPDHVNMGFSGLRTMNKGHREVAEMEALLASMMRKSAGLPTPLGRRAPSGLGSDSERAPVMHGSSHTGPKSFEPISIKKSIMNLRQTTSSSDEMRAHTLQAIARMIPQCRRFTHYETVVTFRALKGAFTDTEPEGREILKEMAKQLEIFLLGQPQEYAIQWNVITAVMESVQHMSGQYDEVRTILRIVTNQLSKMNGTVSLPVAVGDVVAETPTRPAPSVTAAGGDTKVDKVNSEENTSGNVADRLSFLLDCATYMTCSVDDVPEFLSALIPHVADQVARGRVGFDRAISMIYTLKYKSSDYPEVRTLLSLLTTAMSQSEQVDILDERRLNKLLVGMTLLNSAHIEVRQLAAVLVSKLKVTLLAAAGADKPDSKATLQSCLIMASRIKGLNRSHAEVAELFDILLRGPEAVSASTILLRLPIDATAKNPIPANLVPDTAATVEQVNSGCGLGDAAPPKPKFKPKPISAHIKAVMKGVAGTHVHDKSKKSSRIKMGQLSANEPVAEISISQLSQALKENNPDAAGAFSSVGSAKETSISKIFRSINSSPLPSGSFVRHGTVSKSLKERLDVSHFLSALQNNSSSEDDAAGAGNASSTGDLIRTASESSSAISFL
jgi:hypothetical protein